ncbi:DUF3068 domain-containing protein [Streptomyces sp. RB6PN25]|uniref:DUF3068 domain-containing protein n=1 Tax=Streptomyces humicola TaxID=2953240 RepID=A0ABT1Q4A3_9ACTN|nr:DUF3068 domain-containing protein [Streptomyces humicola]MCQ4084748.1 DUF3068 domain-containing protein [Streptomyces humicola]
MHGRRIVAFLVLGLGIFLLVLGPMLRWFVLPRVQVAPYDMDFTDISSGPGTYLDPATGKTESGTLTATRHALGDVAEGKRVGKAVWDISIRLDTPQTIHLPDARQAFNLSVHRWVFDRHTTTSSPCCGGDTGMGADAYLKYPFNTGHHSYRVWDSTAGKAFRADYTGTRTLYGRTFNQYTMIVPPTPIGTIQVPPAVVGQPTRKDGSLITVEEWYHNPAAVNLVDPLTGAPVGGSSHQIVTLRLPGGSKDLATALDVQLQATDATEKALVDKFAGKHDGLALLTGPVPYGMAGLGALGVAAGCVLLLRGRPGAPRHRQATGPAPEPAPAGGALR